MDKQNNKQISIENSVLAFIQSREYVKVRDICFHLNMRDERAVRKMVENLRERGEPICFCNKGYYYSQDPNEIQMTIQKLLLQASGQLRTAKNLKITKEKLEKAN